MASLFAMLLATSHVADWFIQVDHGVDLASVEEGWFARQFPIWDEIRKLANGLKHAKRVHVDRLSHEDPVPSLDLSWGHNGFWNGETWAVEWNSEWRAVSRLCELFLGDFEARSSEMPSPPLRVRRTL
ncbi:hypothetical protein [Bosea rubneri]|uniref:Uncharacterized protein n=1 Tax=Bosea rubneri TaxID=3075434 RepID=A0ABU3SFW3_9HYPH|nr:hypothetical protein [Bosea sp. ZW T0_25]MDU0343556.1 hypothetical protein [Bosea sp. ZW T0_25]